MVEVCIRYGMANAKNPGLTRISYRGERAIPQSFLTTDYTDFTDYLFMFNLR